MIDRIAPTQRPDLPIAGWQGWRSLLFIHWPVDIATLREQVPADLELDLLDGKAYVGIVPFVMQDVRPGWLPKSLSLNLLETKLRTYVIYRGKPGVYFFSLDANSWLAVQAARWGWGLPYHHARLDLEQRDEAYHYQLRRRRSNVELQVRYQPTTMLGASRVDSAEHFLLERYLLFVRRGRHLFMGQVHHSPYPAQAVEIHSLRENMLANRQFRPLVQEPSFSHYASGVDVEIFPLRRVS